MCLQAQNISHLTEKFVAPKTTEPRDPAHFFRAAHFDSKNGEPKQKKEQNHWMNFQRQSQSGVFSDQQT